MSHTYRISHGFLDIHGPTRGDFEFYSAEDALDYLAEAVDEAFFVTVTRDGVEIDERDLPYYMSVEDMEAEEAACKGGMNI